MKVSICVCGIVVALMLTTCKDNNVYEKYHRSVVMICHQFMYTASLKSDTIYFNFDEASGLLSHITLEQAKAEANAQSTFGTGFFIDDQGTVATNRHVVHNITEQHVALFKQILNDSLLREEQQYAEAKDSLERVIQSNIVTLALAKAQYNLDPANEEIMQAQAALDTNKTYRDRLWTVIEFIKSYRTSLADMTYAIRTLFVGFTTEATFDNTINSFQPCDIVRYAEDPRIDLALIQSRAKRLPAGTDAIISLYDVRPEPLKVGDEVSILGFNMGPLISVTNAGLRVQHTVGRVSQEPDDIKVLYSIAMLQGASGSPVFSREGRLVAINFASVRETQSFNYGILANHLIGLASGHPQAQH